MIIDVTMKSQIIEDLSSKQLIDKFNDYLFSIYPRRQSEIIQSMTENDISAYKAFPKLVIALKKNFQFKLLKELKDKKIRDAIETLQQIFQHSKNKEISYFALEALGLFDWKEYPIETRNSFKEFLEIIVEGGYYDVFRFLARVIAYWHFQGEFEFDGFIGGSYFEEEDCKLMEPLLLKALEYSITGENNYPMDYEAAKLTGILKIRKAKPLLIEACKKIHFINDGIYDESKDWYYWLRHDAVFALGEIIDWKTDSDIKALFLDMLQTDPSFFVVLEVIYNLNAFQSQEIIPYLKGLKHKSIGQFVTMANEIDLVEAIVFSLKRWNAQPANYIEYAAERTVFFRFDAFDESEFVSFFCEFPVLNSGDFLMFFKKVVEELSYFDYKIFKYIGPKQHLEQIAEIFLLLGILKIIPDLRNEIDKMTNMKKKTCASLILSNMKLGRKSHIKSTISQIDQENRKYRMILSESTRKWIDYSLFPENFQKQMNTLVSQYRNEEITETLFYEKILDSLYETTISLIKENKQDLKPAAVVLLKKTIHDNLFLNTEEKEEIFEKIKNLVYIDN